MFILCVSPLQTNAQETLNTMKFGQRLQGISQTLVQQAPASPAPASPMGREQGRHFDPVLTRARESFAWVLSRELAWSLLGLALYASMSVW